mgnify:FL=1
MRFSSNTFRKWCRLLHRDLSFLFAGMVFIYAISGLYMNHRDVINPHYSVSVVEQQLVGLPTQAEMDREAVEKIMADMAISEQYTKHYFPQAGTLKVFLKGG